MNHLGKPISEGSKIVTRDVFARFFRLMTNNDRDTDSVIHELFEILDENSRGYLVSWSVRAEFIWFKGAWRFLWSSGYHSQSRRNRGFVYIPKTLCVKVSSLCCSFIKLFERNTKSRKISATLRDIAESFWYSVFLFVISILNYSKFWIKCCVVLITLVYIAILYFEYFETHDSGDRNELFVVVCEWGFLAIFLLDAAFRATAFGTQRFFLNNLNMYIFIIDGICVSLIH